MKSIILAAMLLAAAPAMAQTVSCQRNGDWTYCSDGSTIQRNGDYSYVTPAYRPAPSFDRPRASVDWGLLDTRPSCYGPARRNGFC